MILFFSIYLMIWDQSHPSRSCKGYLRSNQALPPRVTIFENVHTFCGYSVILFVPLFSKSCMFRFNKCLLSYEVLEITCLINQKLRHVPNTNTARMFFFFILNNMLLLCWDQNCAFLSVFFLKIGHSYCHCFLRYPFM